MKKFVLLFILVICINFVHAGYYEVAVSTDFDQSIGVGNNKLGEILLTRTATNATSHLFVNFTPIIIDRYDKIINNAGEIVNINGTNKNSGELWDIFSTPGTYHVSGLSSNLTTTIIVNELPQPFIEITFMNLNLAWKVSKNNFSMTTDEIIPLNLTIPDNTPPTTHSPYLIVKVNTVQKPALPFSFRIEDLKLWNLKSMAIIDSVDAGKTGQAGNLTFANKGNSVSTVNLSITGNISNVLSLPTSTTIFPTVETSLQFIYNLGPAIVTGNYTGVLHMQGEGLTDTRNISIEVKDVMKPEILEVEIPEFPAGLDRTMRIRIKDNTGVKSVKLTRLLKTTPVLNENLGDVVFIKDQQTDWWTGTFSLSKPGNYQLLVTATDIDNNPTTQTYETSVLLQNVVQYREYYKFLTTKYDMWSVLEEFVQMNESVPLTIQLVSVSYSGNGSSFTMAVELPNGEYRYFDKTPAGTYTPIVTSAVGNYKLRFKGNVIGSYNGLIKLTTTAPHQPFRDIVFDGEVKDFYVPPPYHSDWYGGVLDCNVNDGGNPETSSTVCTLQYNGYVDIKQQALPVTSELKLKKDDEFNAEINRMKKEVAKKTFIIVIMSIMLFSILFWAYYIAKVYPIFNVKWR